MKGVDATNEFVLDTAVPVLVPPEPSTPIFYSKNKEARTERTCISAQTRSDDSTWAFPLLLSSPSRSISSLSFFLSSPLLSSPSFGLSVFDRLYLRAIFIGTATSGRETKRGREKERERKEGESVLVEVAAEGSTRNKRCR